MLGVYIIPSYCDSALKYSKNKSNMPWFTLEICPLRNGWKLWSAEAGVRRPRRGKLYGFLMWWRALWRRRHHQRELCAHSYEWLHRQGGCSEGLHTKAWEIRWDLEQRSHVRQEQLGGWWTEGAIRDVQEIREKNMLVRKVEVGSVILEDLGNIQAESSCWE